MPAPPVRSGVVRLLLACFRSRPCHSHFLKITVCVNVQAFKVIGVGGSPPHPCLPLRGWLAPTGTASAMAEAPELQGMWQEDIGEVRAQGTLTAADIRHIFAVTQCKVSLRGRKTKMRVLTVRGPKRRLAEARDLAWGHIYPGSGHQKV